MAVPCEEIRLFSQYLLFFVSLQQRYISLQMRNLLILLFLLMSVNTWAQGEKMLVMHGRVTSGGKAVPYATLQLVGTSVGVACNDDGEYMLKVPTWQENDTVVIRSVGFRQERRTVKELLDKGNVRLTEQNTQLREVEVKSYRKAINLINAAVERIDSNYQQQSAVSTFFYRDWRAVDGELYLFDEAVLAVRRMPYSSYARKMAYRFATDKREMASNFKTLLRHRLLVFDPVLLSRKIDDPEGIEEMMSYADNEEFYDPVATPQASFSLSHRTLPQHTFETVQEYSDDGVMYYQVRSIGPGRLAKSKVRYVYTIRKSDLAIVRITAAQEPLQMVAGNDAWINIEFNRLGFDSDSSVWCYDVREGRYTLTRYYNSRSFYLGVGTRLDFKVAQRWMQCTDWTLTDFVVGEKLPGDIIGVKPMTMPVVFGSSDYSSDYWLRYNSIPIDMLPLKMLNEKLQQKNEK